MQFGINSAVIGFLIHDQAFSPGPDERNVVLDRHRADLDRNRRKIRRQRANAFEQIIFTDELRMLTRNQQKLSETGIAKEARLSEHFLDAQGHA